MDEIPVTPTETVEQQSQEQPAQVTPEEVAELRAALKKANNEAAARRKKLDEYEAAEKAKADEQLTKEQLLEKQVAEARQEAETARMEANAKLLKSAVLLKASALGFEHPADAFALADLSKIEQDEAGDYTDKSIEAVLKPLIGRLPVKAQGAGVGTPKLPATQTKQEPEKKGRVFNRPF